MLRPAFLLFLFALLIPGFAGCSKQGAAIPPEPARGGVIVSLGENRFFLEIVVDRQEGALQVHTLDAQGAPLKTSNEGLELRIAVGNAEPRFLILSPIALLSQNQFAGNTPLYGSKIEWLKTDEALSVEIDRVIVSGRRFDSVRATLPAVTAPAVP